MWRLTIARLAPMIMGILRSDLGVPSCARSIIIGNLVNDVQVLLDLAPPNLTQFCYELEDDLLQIAKSPTLSN